MSINDGDDSDFPAAFQLDVEYGTNQDFFEALFRRGSTQMCLNTATDDIDDDDAPNNNSSVVTPVDNNDEVRAARGMMAAATASPPPNQKGDNNNNARRTYMHGSRDNIHPPINHNLCRTPHLGRGFHDSPLQVVHVATAPPGRRLRHRPASTATGVSGRRQERRKAATASASSSRSMTGALLEAWSGRVGPSPQYGGGPSPQYDHRPVTTGGGQQQWRPPDDERCVWTSSDERRVHKRGCYVDVVHVVEEAKPPTPMEHYLNRLPAGPSMLIAPKNWRPLQQRHTQPRRSPPRFGRNRAAKILKLRTFGELAKQHAGSKGRPCVPVGLPERLMPKTLRQFERMQQWRAEQTKRREAEIDWQRRNDAATRIQSIGRANAARREARGRRNDRNDQLETAKQLARDQRAAAIKLQCVHRGGTGRIRARGMADANRQQQRKKDREQQIQIERHQISAAQKLQAQLRGHNTRRKRTSVLISSVVPGDWVAAKRMLTLEPQHEENPGDVIGEPVIVTIAIPRRVGAPLGIMFCEKRHKAGSLAAFLQEEEEFDVEDERHLTRRAARSSRRLACSFDEQQHIEVSALQPGGLGMQHGLLCGDWVLKIDDELVVGVGFDAAMTVIRSRSSTAAAVTRLTVRRFASVAKPAVTHDCQTASGMSKTAKCIARQYGVSDIAMRCIIRMQGHARRTNARRALKKRRRLFAVERDKILADKPAEGFPWFDDAGGEETGVALSLTQAVYEKLAPLRTSSGYSIDRCIQNAVDVPDGGTLGMVCGDEDCYTLFEPVVIASLEAVHSCEMPACHKWDESASADRRGSYREGGERTMLPTTDHLKTLTIATSRNLCGFPFTPAVSRSQRREIERLLEQASARVDGFTRSTQEVSSLRFFPPSALAAGVYGDWPDARCLLTRTRNPAAAANKRERLWINCADHCVIEVTTINDEIARLAGGRGDYLDRLFHDTWDRLCSLSASLEEALSKEVGAGFVYSRRFGYLAADPNDMARSIRLTADVDLPVLVATFRDGSQFDTLCNNLGLDATATCDASVGGTWRLRNVDALGLTSREHMRTFQRGVTTLLQMDAALSSGDADQFASICSNLPQQFTPFNLEPHAKASRGRPAAPLHATTAWAPASSAVDAEASVPIFTELQLTISSAARVLASNPGLYIRSRAGACSGVTSLSFDECLRPTTDALAGEIDNAGPPSSSLTCDISSPGCVVTCQATCRAHREFICAVIMDWNRTKLDDDQGGDVWPSSSADKQRLNDDKRPSMELDPQLEHTAVEDEGGACSPMLIQPHHAEKIRSCSCSVTRNIASLPFSSTVSRGQRRSIENLVLQAALALNDEPGKARRSAVAASTKSLSIDDAVFGSNNGGDNSDSDNGGVTRYESASYDWKDAAENRWLARTQVLRDWPDGRGVFTAQPAGTITQHDERVFKAQAADRPHILLQRLQRRKLQCFVNYTDHVRVQSSGGADDFAGVFRVALCGVDRLMTTLEEIAGMSFARDKGMGFVTTSPALLGTGLSCRFVLAVPKLVAAPRDTLVALCTSLGLCWSIQRATSSKEEDGADDDDSDTRHLVVWNRRAFGLSEPEIALQTAVAAIRVIEVEIALEHDHISCEAAVAAAQMSIGDDRATIVGNALAHCGASVVRGFPRYIAAHTSAMSRCMTPVVYEALSLTDGSGGLLRTKCGGCSLDDCIQVGVDVPFSRAGCTAGDAECYETFRAMFDPVISLLHGGYTPNFAHKFDIDPSHVTPCDLLTPPIALSSRVRCVRNLTGFPMGVAATRSSRRAVETVLERALARLEGSVGGTFVSIASASSEQLELLNKSGIGLREPRPGSESHAAGLCSDWPHGRAVFYNGTATIVCSVNPPSEGGDHLQIAMTHPTGDLCAAFAEWSNFHVALERSLLKAGHSFMFSQRLGFISACPTNLGAGLYAGVVLHLPRVVECAAAAKKTQWRILSHALAFKAPTPGRTSKLLAGLCKHHRLVAQGPLAGECTVLVSNADTMGLSECEIVQTVCNGAAELVRHENELQLAADADGGGDSTKEAWASRVTAQTESGSGRVPHAFIQADRRHRPSETDPKALKPKAFKGPSMPSMPTDDNSRRPCVLATTLTRTDWNSTVAESKRAGWSLDRATRSATDAVSSSFPPLPIVGVVAAFPHEFSDDSYMRRLFDPAIEALHGVVDARANKQRLDDLDGNASSLALRTPTTCRTVQGALGNDEREAAASCDVWIEATRNLDGFAFSPAITRRARRDIADLIKGALERLSEGEFRGTFYDLLLLGDKQAAPADQQALYMRQMRARGLQPLDAAAPPKALAHDSELGACGAGRDWPQSRGFFVSEAGTFIIEVNTTDHLRIWSFRGEGTQEVPSLSAAVDEVSGTFARGIAALQAALHAELHDAKGVVWATEPSLGYVGASLANLGTAMRLHIPVVLPNCQMFADDAPAARQSCSDSGLVARPGLADATCVVSIASTVGFNEREQLQRTVGGVERLIATDKTVAMAQSPDSY